jgi:hypothetical protein
MELLHYTNRPEFSLLNPNAHLLLSQLVRALDPFDMDTRFDTIIVNTAVKSNPLCPPTTPQPCHVLTKVAAAAALWEKREA